MASTPGTSPHLIWPINALQRVEFEIILLVKPGALEVLERQIASATQRERVDRKLDVGVFFFSRFGLVVEKVDEAIANLQKIYMACDDGAVEVECETSISVVRNVRLGEIHRNFDGNGHGVVRDHETLKRLMTLFVAG